VASGAQTLLRWPGFIPSLLFLLSLLLLLALLISLPELLLLLLLLGPTDAL
jgi:hypothetical protein